LTQLNRPPVVAARNLLRGVAKAKGVELPGGRGGGVRRDEAVGAAGSGGGCAVERANPIETLRRALARRSGGPLMNKLLLSAALALALTPSLTGDAVAATSFQFSFINHTNMQLNFSIDGAYACTANAGMVCYSHIGVGPHAFRAAMGDQTIAETSATIHENAQGPTWTVCNSDNGVCP